MREPPPQRSLAVFTNLLRSTILVTPRGFGGSSSRRVGGLGPVDLLALGTQLLEPVDELLALEVTDLTLTTATSLGGRGP